MNISTKIAAAAGLLLTGALAAGCAGQAASASRVTIGGCADYGVIAIRQHRILVSLPPACRGLSAAAVNDAVTRAIHQVVGGQPKALGRRLAGLADASIGDLVTSPAPAASAAAPSVPLLTPVFSAAPTAAVARAALISWVLTAATGAYLLSIGMQRGGARAPRRLRRGLPPAVILAHAGLAVAGLAWWIGYLVVGWTVLAWTAVGLLLPVVGLGMATLVAGMPAAGSPEPRPARPPGRGRPPVLLITIHGALATATLLLALLAAVGAGL